MKPWELEKSARKAAEWMREKWIGRYRGQPFGWTPWALTADNKDDQPEVFTLTEAEEIFKRLREEQLLIYHEFKFKVADGSEAGVWLLTLHSDTKTLRFIDSATPWNSSIKPFLIWLKNHKFMIWFIGILSLTLAAGLAKIAENFVDNVVYPIAPSKSSKNPHEEKNQ